MAAGGAWPDDVLSLRDRSLIVIASLITQGGPRRGCAGTCGGRSNTARTVMKSRRSSRCSPSMPVTRGPSHGMEVVRDELDQLEREAE